MGRFVRPGVFAGIISIIITPTECPWDPPQLADYGSPFLLLCAHIALVFKGTRYEGPAAWPLSWAIAQLKRALFGGVRTLEVLP